MRQPDEVPVLLLAFRRPDCTAAVIEALRTVGSRQVTFACDGPRASGGTIECEEVETVRALVSRFHPACRVTTWFSSTNLGCREHVSKSITDFLDAHDEGLILEDDCVPGAGFARFASEALDRWRHHDRVGSIAGSLLTRQRPAPGSVYRFSAFTSSWGWATWRRAWADRDLSLDAWQADRTSLVRRFTPVVGGPASMRRWASAFDQVRGGHDSWATGWFFSNLLHGRLTAVPNVNLITNIGFGEAATHTRGAMRYTRPVELLTEPVHHPAEPVPDSILDRAMAQEIFAPSSGWQKLRLAMSRPLALIRRVVGSGR